MPYPFNTKQQQIFDQLKAFVKDKTIDTYILNSLRASYGYVVTCHKAQGGEWNHVYLFLDKKMYSFLNTDQLRRWWYTAITRTKEHLYLHDDWWII
ncbi:MAG: ATP-binding domain-containing protein [Chitinophagaceae bacterium]|nr:ATP-binding domain-containing protein [Chitinophagaceae bacterium]